MCFVLWPIVLSYVEGKTGISMSSVQDSYWIGQVLYWYKAELDECIMHHLAVLKEANRETLAVPGKNPSERSSWSITAMVSKSLLWNVCSSIIAIECLPWYHTMGSLQYYCCPRITAVLSLPWNVWSSIITMECLQSYHYHGMFVVLSLP